MPDLYESLSLLGIVRAYLMHPRRALYRLAQTLPAEAVIRYLDELPRAKPREAPKAIESVRNPVLDIFLANVQGPGIWKWTHYFEAYHRHLSKFVGRPVDVIEVGVYSGGSLNMWRQYFGPLSKVVGVDIERACEFHRTDGIDIVIGDQADRAFWRSFRETRPEIDVLIDDGGHLPEQQRVTFEEMLWV